MVVGKVVDASKDIVARVDLDRQVRIGMPEAIYGSSKTDEEIREIVKMQLNNGNSPVLITRCRNSSVSELFGNPEIGEHVVRVYPDLEVEAPFRTVVVGPMARGISGKVAILTGGTSDLRVAYECHGTLDWLGVESKTFADVGVANLERFFSIEEELREFDALVVIAGMEGALATIAASRLGQPIVAVPSSVGYGSSLEGVTALLSMTASCAQGVSVVGIDNGFGAACSCFRICRSFSEKTDGRAP